MDENLLDYTGIWIKYDSNDPTTYPDKSIGIYFTRCNSVINSKLTNIEMHNMCIRHKFNSEIFKVTHWLLQEYGNYD